MDCVEGYIKLKASCTSGEKSRSGLYIEDLEGLNIKKLAQIQDGAQINAKEMVDAALRVASGLVLEKIKSNMLPYFVNSGMLESASVDEFEQTTAPTNGDTGIIIRKKYTALTEMFISAISVLVNQDITDEVIEFRFGNTIETVSVTATAGKEISVSVNIFVPDDEVLITWTTDAISVNTGDLKGLSDFKSCRSCRNTHHRCNYLSFHGVLAGVEDSVLYGIRPDITVVCSFEKAFCRMLSLLKYPILYQTGVELMKREEATDRINFFALFSKEWAMEKRAEWEEITIPRLLKPMRNQIGTFLSNIDPDCVQCGGTRYVEPTP